MANFQKIRDTLVKKKRPKTNAERVTALEQDVDELKETITELTTIIQTRNF